MSRDQEILLRHLRLDLADARCEREFYLAVSKDLRSRLRYAGATIVFLLVVVATLAMFIAFQSIPN